MKNCDFCGCMMTEAQMKELLDILKEDILDRYNNSEYWDNQLVDDFAQDNNLKRRKDKNDGRK